MARWVVATPHGSRTAPSWPRAVEMLCQDVKTSLLAKAPARIIEGAARATWAEERAWAYIRPWAEYRSSFGILVGGAFHEVRPK